MSDLINRDEKSDIEEPQNRQFPATLRESENEVARVVDTTQTPEFAKYIRDKNVSWLNTSFDFTSAVRRCSKISVRLEDEMLRGSFTE